MAPKGQRYKDPQKDLLWNMIHERWERKKGDGKLEAWRVILALQPPIEQLTEKEWEELCKEWERCAYCNSSDISIRSYFIPAKIEGTYNRYNILPSCSECAVQSSNIMDPFKRWDIYVNDQLRLRKNRSYLFNVKTIHNLTNYLLGQLVVPATLEERQELFKRLTLHYKEELYSDNPKT